MFGIAGTAELSTFCPGTGTWNRLQDGIASMPDATYCPALSYTIGQSDQPWQHPTDIISETLGSTVGQAAVVGRPEDILVTGQKCLVRWPSWVPLFTGSS